MCWCINAAFDRQPLSPAWIASCVNCSSNKPRVHFGGLLLVDYYEIIVVQICMDIKMGMDMGVRSETAIIVCSICLGP